MAKRNSELSRPAIGNLGAINATKLRPWGGGQQIMEKDQEQLERVKDVFREENAVENLEIP